MIFVLGLSLGLTIGMNIGFERGIKANNFSCYDTGVPIMEEKIMNLSINLSDGGVFLEQGSDNNGD